MNKNVWVIAITIGLVGIVIFILSTGGPPPPGTDDAVGDVLVEEGPNAPADTALADIVSADVRKDGPTVLFEVTLGSPIPKKVPKGSLEFRWDLSEQGDDTWIVSANLAFGPTASVTSQETNYGSSTIDGSLPGDIKVEGNTLRITVQPGAIRRFPERFEWRLTTTLDADQANPRSAVATDTAPDAGPRAFN